MKKFLTLNLILFLATVVSIVYYFSAFECISKNVVRLHIIPNSNSEQDMSTKLSVRDKILSAMQKEVDNKSSRNTIINSTKKIETLANSYLNENGIAYSASAKAEIVHIPRKSYNGITMPAGKYTAIQVVLGDGAGDNWWCVAYPPLCFTEEVFGSLSPTGKEQLQKKIGKNGYSIISEEINFELKIVELAEKIIDRIKTK